MRLEGEFVHAGIYTVLPGETLRQLVERAGGFTPNAYLYGSEFTRTSARAIQQARIDEYVASMNLSIQRGTRQPVTAPAATPQDLASTAAATGLERELLATLKRSGPPAVSYCSSRRTAREWQSVPISVGGWRPIHRAIHALQRERCGRCLRSATPFFTRKTGA